MDLCIIGKKDFPFLQDQFKDDNACFALGTTRGHFFITDLSLASFSMLKGRLGKIMQKFGITAFRFNENNKIQYLIDLELFIKHALGVRND